MDSTLAALQEILIRAIPTVLLVIVLHFYLKFVFLKPLREVLGKRYAAGEGARRQAEAMIAKAEQKTAEYESRLAEVRSQIYKEQEMERSRFRAEQDAKIEHSRQQAARLVHAAH